MSGITILDGGMGQELVARAPEAPTGLWSTKIMMDHPELVRAVHDDFFAAGAEVATTASYAIMRDRLAPVGLEDQFAALHRQACTLAVASRDAHGSGQVAGALGPLGWSYRADLAPPVAEAAEHYAEMAALQAAYVDLLILETMSGIDQARGGLMGATTAGKPVWLGLSVDDTDGTRLRNGDALADVAPLLGAFQPAAVLINCSTPEAIDAAIPIIAEFGLPFGAYANGFTKITADFAQAGQAVDKLQARQDLSPDAYADFALGWVDHGATIIGGCCEVGPAHIAELSRRFS